MLSKKKLSDFAKGTNEKEFMGFHKFLFNYHLLIPGKRVLTREEAQLILKVEFANRLLLIAKYFFEFMIHTRRLDINLQEWLAIPKVFETLSTSTSYDKDESCIKFI